VKLQFLCQHIHNNTSKPSTPKSNIKENTVKQTTRRLILQQLLSYMSVTAFLAAITLTLSLLAYAPAHAASAFGQCPADRPCITVLSQTGHTLSLTWSPPNYDGYNVFWSRPGSSNQFHVDGSTTATLSEIYPYTTYTFSVEGCDTHFLAPSTCSPWSSSEQITTVGSSADVCVQGFVWREAGAQDFVCVTPNVRSQAAYDNSQASVRRDPAGPYGPDTCVQGFVWREAFSNDQVCVTPQTRSEAAADNSQAVYRVVH
jgi:Fibronectin type III domain